MQQRLLGDKHLKMMLQASDGKLVDAIWFNADNKNWPNANVQQVQLALGRLADALRDSAQQQPTVIVHEDAGTTPRKRRPKPEKLKKLDEQLDMIDFHRKPAE